MKNKQVLPFERNRYYSGKMLSSSDFILEQTYHNNKRRFMNRMMFGSGIVCGLSVYNLDDLSLMVDSGVAIDAYGREIVIENTVIKKLTAISGFEELETDTASLCIRYEEIPVHSVYAPNTEGSESEFNHIDEGYELYLVDKDKTASGFEVESEFLLRGELLHTEDYTIDLSVPAVVCMGKSAKILLTLTKHTEEPAEFSYRGIIQMPLFTTADGLHETEIVLEDNTLEAGESLAKEIWVRVQNLPTEKAKIIIKPGSVEAMVNKILVTAEDNFYLDIVIADINPRDLVDRELGKTSLEMRDMSGKTDFVKLADISFKRTDTGCMIEKIEERKAKKYIEAPSDGAVRNQYLEYYAMYTTEEKRTKLSEIEEQKEVSVFGTGVRCSGGYFEIPLIKGASRGEVYYSGEILHTLGNGDVYVEIGCEGKEQNASVGAEVKTIVYGTTGIFKTKGTNLPSIETAVKVIGEKGTFIAGIRFLKDYSGMVLRCKWTAIKAAEKRKEDIGDGEGKEPYITTEKSTLLLEPKSTCYIQVKFKNMEASRLYYELTETGSGEISEDGVYTAPEKEGVFEIHISCAHNPFISTYVYAVVKRKREDG
ncbi:MAG: hypothetical protein K2N34_00625 [Lachnospiraceae bacterium]|nr:hypothetical protein [Lachnospiraceae bacterium]